jgi:Tetratricopeptide repeat
MKTLTRFAATSSILLIGSWLATALLLSAGQKPEAMAKHLGNVHFPTSCSPKVQGTFDTGVALLHSFQYERASTAFADVAQQDPGCAMAYWGEAMSLYHQLWDWPSAETLAKGRAFIDKANQVGAKTERERAYIVAAATFFQDNSKLTHAERAGDYSKAMEQVYSKNPKDVNAGAFYALSLVALPAKGEEALTNDRKAIAILDKLFVEYPDHPGVAHYLIHASDSPQLAPQGLAAARRYGQIAPDSAHALHMPTHIFSRLGLWQDSIKSNIASAASAARATHDNIDNEAHNQLHALDFLEYAYLERGMDQKACGVIDEVRKVEGASEGEMASHQAYFQARYDVITHNWKDAANLAAGPNVNTEAQADVYWARTIGAARSGDATGARRNLQKLDEVYTKLNAENSNRGYTVEKGKSIEQMEAEAWLEYAEGKHEPAIASMRAAADKEESEGMETLAVPARIMLGDMLLEASQPAEALAAYETAQKESPNRFDGLYGAARAAEQSGNKEKAKAFYAKLDEICGPNADREELKHAREYIASR